MTDLRWLTTDEHAALAVALDHTIPPNGPSPGAGEAGGADYVDLLLGAFTFEPPRIWAGGPFSGRHGGEAGFDRWLELGPIEELAWRIRIEGSGGRPEREFNGPTVGYQQTYRDGLTGLGADFATGDPADQAARIAASPEAFRDLLFTHACEALYGDPVYGGNRASAAWQAIDFAGDVQPRGWTDAEVEQP